jgi:hypothetical protein
MVEWVTQYRTRDVCDFAIAHRTQNRLGRRQCGFEAASLRFVVLLQSTAMQYEGAKENLACKGRLCFTLSRHEDR